MKKLLLSMMAALGMYAANAQCNAIVFDAPNQNLSYKYCAGTPTILYAYATGGTNIKYTWYHEGIAITTPSLSNTYPLNNLQPSNAGSYTVQVTSDDCPSGVTSQYALTLQVDTAIPPTVSSLSTSSFSPCVGTTNTYGVGMPNAGLYNWSWTLPNGWSGSSYSSGITLTVADTATSIMATATNGCGSRDFSFGFVTPVAGVPSAPDSIMLHSGALCEGQQVYLRVPIKTGEQYDWIFPADWVNTPYVVEGIVTVTPASTGTVRVTAKNGCGIATDTLSQLITIYPTPATPILQQVGNTIQTTAVAASYDWEDYNETYYEYDTVIIGPTGNTFTPQGNSTYVLWIQNEGGCGAESDPFEFTGFVGIGDVANAEYTIYPNPASNVINIKSEAALDITITDLQGRVVYEAKDVVGTHSISTNHMGNGAYLLHTNKGTKLSTTKLLIAK